jgi:hypothetical protein
LSSFVHKRKEKLKREEAKDHLILVGPQAGPEGLLVAVKDGLDATRMSE